MYKIGKLGWKSIINTCFIPYYNLYGSRLAKFDISLKNTPPDLAPFCTESWQRFPPIFFSISLATTNIVVRVHTKNYGKTRKTKGIYRKTRKLCGGESAGLQVTQEDFKELKAQCHLLSDVI